MVFQQMVSLMLAEARSQLRMATGCYWRPMWKGIIDWQKLSVHQLELATEAAVNCSSMTRHTALHLAAADGRHESVEVMAPCRRSTPSLVNTFIEFCAV